MIIFFNKQLHRLLFIISVSYFHFIAIINAALYSPSIDMNEIENFKYEIAIGKSIKLNQKDDLKDAHSFSNSILEIKKVHGQTYQCRLPEILKSLEDDEEEGKEDTATSKLERETNLNFTLINEKIVAYFDGLKKSQHCLYKNTGWWTYEFCFGQHASQYHKLRMYLYTRTIPFFFYIRTNFFLKKEFSLKFDIF
jgi:hypothetical protein